MEQHGTILCLGNMTIRTAITHFPNLRMYALSNIMSIRPLRWYRQSIFWLLAVTNFRKKHFTLMAVISFLHCDVIKYFLWHWNLICSLINLFSQYNEKLCILCLYTVNVAPYSTPLISQNISSNVCICESGVEAGKWWLQTKRCVSCTAVTHFSYIRRYRPCQKSLWAFVFPGGTEHPNFGCWLMD